MKKFTKNIVKEFKNSFGRFLAIMAIIALGVGFLIGISQSTPDMKTSMSEYLRQNSAYDIDVKAGFGLTASDIAAITELEDDEGDAVVSGYMSVVTSSVMASINGAKSTAVNLIGLDFSVVEAGGGLNNLTLEEGEWPTEPNQVVVERSNNYFESVELGCKITLESNLDTSNSTYGDIYAQTEFEVVGIVSSPDYYYTDAREVTTIGTGVVSLVMYGNYTVKEQTASDGTVEYVASGVYNLSKSLLLGTFMPALRSESVIYTDLWVTIAGADGYECFYDDYKNYVLERAEYITALGGDINEKINSSIQNNSLISAYMTEEASWYVLDRASTNVSYISFDMNVEKLEDIAGIFPVFFIIVAALVAFTSMTRMVEEDRMQIGTLKALGYNEGDIMSKYLIYCILACLIGVAVGILLGFSIMPTIFWNAYGTMYYLPELVLGFSWWLAIAVIFGALAITIIVTVIACRSATKEKPSVLMQPKAPKPGKRILLEKCTPVWKRITFRWKATIRNIFRYKRNMILTIISVCGCTALILTGFGLADGVEAVTTLQYNNIIHYDTIIGHTAAQTASADGELAAYLDGLDEDDYLDVYSESGQIVINNSSYETVDLYLIDDVDTFYNFVNLHGRSSGKELDAGEGVILPENITTAYDISVGDTITYITASGVQIELEVTGVCEYYTGSDVYMSKAVFAQNTGQSVTANTYLVKYGYGEDEELMNEDAEKLLSDSSVTSVEFTYTTVRSFDALNETMSFVILILIVCAGALAAIVLYNLTNINIDERRREIATLRVLGYSKWEVAGYIYRESAILTVVGALLGLLAGWLLHMFIVGRVNSVMMMFGKAIAWTSFIWSFLITIGFAIVVYAFMLIKLYRINMAESLKSNE